MSGEIQGSFAVGQDVYALIRDRNANIWNTVTNSLQSYNSANYSGYPISCTQQGSASAYYVGNFPSAAPPGDYNVVLKNQIAANPAETDPTTDAGTIPWNGTNVAQLSDIPVSGYALFPLVLSRGWMITKYPIRLVSSADHITPILSGTVSGQISRDGGAFTALQSGAFTEVGFGVYTTTLTSGDLFAKTVSLYFTAVAAGGGASDPLVQSYLLQRTSGY